MHHRFDLRTGRCLESKLEATGASWIPHFGVCSRCKQDFALVYRMTEGVWFQLRSTRLRVDNGETFFFHTRKLGGVCSELRVEPKHPTDAPILVVKKLALFSFMGGPFEKEFFAWVTESANDPMWVAWVTQCWQAVDSSEFPVRTHHRSVRQFQSRLHELLQRLLEHQIDAVAFGIEFEKVYKLELGMGTLSRDEEMVFSLLREKLIAYLSVAGEQKQGVHDVGESSILRDAKKTQQMIESLQQSSDWEGLPMSRQQLENAGWSFGVEEIATGVHRVCGADRLGHSVAATGTNLNALFEHCRHDASRIIATSALQKQ